MTQGPGLSLTSGSADAFERFLGLADRANIRPESLVDALEKSLAEGTRSAGAPPLSDDELHALEAAHIDLSGPSEDEDPAPWTDALSEILRDSLSEDQAAERLGITRSTLRARLSRRQLAGIKQGDDWRLPTWQFNGPRPLPHLKDVLAAAGPLHPLALHRWMTHPDPELALGDDELSPAQWLASGGPVGVVLDLVSALPAAS